MITQELIQKHIRRLVEATVKSHTRTSKTGKVFNVAQHDRDISDAARKAGLNQNTVTKFNRLMKNTQAFANAAAKEKESEEVSMYKQDMKNFQSVFNLVKAGKFSRAESVIDRMDTAPRDDIWRVVGGVITRGERLYKKRHFS